MADKFGKRTHAERTKDFESHKRKGKKAPPHPHVGRLKSKAIQDRIEKAARSYPLSKKKSKVKSFPRDYIERTPKVTSPPRPKRKPKVIISGPGGPNNPKGMKDDLSIWGVSDEIISGLSGSDLRKAWKAQRNIMESRKEGGKAMKKKGGKVLYKRHGGMSHVGLSPAEEARAGTMSELERARYMQGGGPIHTTFPRRAVPRTEGREPEVDLFPKVERKKGKKVGKKEQGYKARKDESIAMRVKKKRTKKQLKASRRESYGKWGKGKGKGKINRVSHKQTDGNKVVASIYD